MLRSVFGSIFIVILIVGFAVPFLWQQVKLPLARALASYGALLADRVVALLSVVLDIVCAVAVLWWFSAITLGNVIGASILIFLVSRTTYDHLVKRFFPVKIV